MARNYIPKGCGLPSELAKQVFHLIRDYNRIKEEYDNTIWNSPDPPDGQPRGSNCGDPTSRQAMRRAELARKLQAIEQSKLEIPEEYRNGVWNSVLYNTPYPVNADRTTYWRQKARFMRKVAEKMFWI